MLSSLTGLFRKREEPHNDNFDESANVSVRSPDELPKLEKLVKSGPVTFIFVHADWCGHCQTYKPIWQQLLSIPGRVANMGMIHHDMVEKSPLLKKAKIPGFPTVLKVLPNGHIETYKGEDSKTTNAVPKMRDVESMTKVILSSTSKANNSVKNSKKDDLVNSLNITPNNNTRLVKLGKRAKKTLKVNQPTLSASSQGNQPTVSAPFQVKQPTVFPSSQTGRRNASSPIVTAGNELLPTTKDVVTIGATPVAPMRGGSLFTALTQALQQAGPTAVLLLANGALPKKTQIPPKKSRGSTMRRTRTNRNNRRSKKLTY
jgi:thiol-disulfide isomerase/thioredoxin